MDILTYINKMNRLYGSEQQVASVKPKPGWQHAPWQDYPADDDIPSVQKVARYNTRQYLQGGRVGKKPGGLVEPGVVHYATLTEAEEKVNIEAWEKRMKPTGKKYIGQSNSDKWKIRQGKNVALPDKPIGKFKYPIINPSGTVYTDEPSLTVEQRKKIKAWEKANPGKEYIEQKIQNKFQIRKKGASYEPFVEFIDQPGVEKRTIELLNEGNDATTTAKILEAEGLVKYPSYFDKTKGKMLKSYVTARSAFNKLLKEGKLEVDEIVKSLGSGEGAKVIKKRNAKILEIVENNPDSNAQEIAKRASIDLDYKVNRVVVDNLMKKEGIDLINRYAKISPELKELNGLIKKNIFYLSRSTDEVPLNAKRKFLFEKMKKKFGKGYDLDSFGRRLETIGRRYLGELDHIKEYADIKGPKNYKNSLLQKNIVGLADKSFLGVVSKARLLGLPKKEIQLLEDALKGASELTAGKISIAGDHTDIDALMKRDFKTYKKNFTRINIISNELNTAKGGADRKLITLVDKFNLIDKPNASQIKEFNEKVQEVRTRFTNKTKVEGFHHFNRKL